MKKVILFLSILFIALCNVFAQNAHWSYGLSSGTSASSAATVVRSNGTAYIAQTQTGTNTIHLSEINPSTMTATGATCTYVNASTYNNIFLNGGFEDFNGNIIVYGYCYNVVGYEYGYIAEIDPNNFFQIKHMESAMNNRMISGCTGVDANGNVINVLVGSDGNLHVFFNGNEQREREYTGQYGYYTDVVWDNTNYCFIASGSCYNNTALMMDPFISCFMYNAIAQQFIIIKEYAISNNNISGWSEGKSLISIIDDNHLVLYQDLRKDNYDIIWMTLVKGFLSTTPVLQISTHFLAPLHKLSSFDMLYDKYNNRLNLLGQFDYCSWSTSFIAQTDPFNLSYLNIGQISSMYGNVSCNTLDVPIQSVIGNDVRLNNITLNPYNPCITTISTGIAKNSFGTTPYLTETYDITMSNCDMLFDVLRAHCFPSLYSIQTHPLPLSCSSSLPMNPVVNLITSHYNECPDAVYCAKSSELTNYEETKSCVISEGNRARIEEYAGTFVCFGFSGAVEYEILDVTGKRICFGKTVNGKPNPINLNQYGLYLLRCIDETGNYCVRKINRK